MSLKKRLEEKSEGLGAPVTQDGVSQTTIRTPRTAPGQMLAFREQMTAASKQIVELEAKLESYEGTLPVRQLDPQRIRSSKLANRHEESFKTREFEDLMDEIAGCGGNVQPILVRPVLGDPAADFEIVFGHRRHRACLQLGLPVLAMIDEISDVELFVTMDRENREREDLTPYELGKHYQRALEAKLWPSQNQMASALGISQSVVSKALTLANLPAEIVEAFPSPLDLQFRWGMALTELLATKRERVMTVAQRLAAERGKHSAGAVFAAFCEKPKELRRAVVVGGQEVGAIRSEGKHIVVRLAARLVEEGRMEALGKAIEAFLEEPGAVHKGAIHSE